MNSKNCARNFGSVGFPAQHAVTASLKSLHASVRQLGRHALPQPEEDRHIAVSLAAAMPICREKRSFMDCLDRMRIILDVHNVPQ